MGSRPCLKKPVSKLMQSRAWDKTSKRHHEQERTPHQCCQWPSQCKGTMAAGTRQPCTSLEAPSGPLQTLQSVLRGSWGYPSQKKGEAELWPVCMAPCRVPLPPTVPSLRCRVIAETLHEAVKDYERQLSLLQPVITKRAGACFRFPVSASAWRLLAVCWPRVCICLRWWWWTLTRTCIVLQIYARVGQTVLRDFMEVDIGSLAGVTNFFRGEFMCSSAQAAGVHSLFIPGE